MATALDYAQMERDARAAEARAGAPAAALQWLEAAQAMEYAQLAERAKAAYIRAGVAAADPRVAVVASLGAGRMLERESGDLIRRGGPDVALGLDASNMAEGWYAKAADLARLVPGADGDRMRIAAEHAKANAHGLFSNDPVMGDVERMQRNPYWRPEPPKGTQERETYEAAKAKLPDNIARQLEAQERIALDPANQGTYGGALGALRAGQLRAEHLNGVAAAAFYEMAITHAAQVPGAGARSVERDASAGLEHHIEAIRTERMQEIQQELKASPGRQGRGQSRDVVHRDGPSERPVGAPAPARTVHRGPTWTEIR